MSLLRNKCPLLRGARNTSSPLKTGLSALCYFVTSTFKIYIRRIINNNNIYMFSPKRRNNVTRAMIGRKAPSHRGLPCYHTKVTGPIVTVTSRNSYVSGPSPRSSAAASPQPQPRCMVTVNAHA